MSYIVSMETTIQVSKELLEKLRVMKIHEKESYENIIWDLIEDRLEFSDETKKNIAEAEKDFKEGNWDNFTSLEEIKKKLGM